MSQRNVLSSTINKSKSKLSTSLQYYLQKYRQVLDIPRLCRALAVPGELAENFVNASKPEQKYTPQDELDEVQYPPIVNQIVQSLQRYLYLRNKNGNDIHYDNNNNLILSNLSANQKEAIYTDINELAVYSKMYHDIETIKSDPLIADEYPHGDPFDHIIDMMSQGAIIIRFKYVSRSSLPPEEKVVSYHLMDFENRKVLGVHIEGEKKFSMYKQWGQGDEGLLPIYPEYCNTIIRWGKEEVEEAIMNKNKSYNTRQFLY